MQRQAQHRQTAGKRQPDDQQQSVAVPVNLSPAESQEAVHPPLPEHNTQDYRLGEVMSQNLWPQYDRRFVGITRHNLWSQGMKIYRAI